MPYTFVERIPLFLSPAFKDKERRLGFLEFWKNPLSRN
jgi:hypothetical protein